MATVVARSMSIPVSEVHLATLGGIRGVISRGFDQPLAHGNELLAAHLVDYDWQSRGPVAGYNLPTIEAVLQGRSSREPGLAAFEMFAGYLLFDALIGNTDRHHENWAVSTTTGALAPSYDHGASLGFNIPPRRRHDIAAVATKGRSRHFEGKPSLVALAAMALDSVRPEVRELWLNRIEGANLSVFNQAVGDVPDSWMSNGARRFVQQLAQENRRRLMCLRY